MSVNRRSVLKGMALSGVAGVTATGWANALAFSPSISNAAAGPVLALTSEGAAESVFLYGARSATGSPSQLHVQRVDRNPGFMLDFERQLRSGNPLRVIGLLDSASAALVLDMARSGGASVQWLGQHTSDSRGSRHHVLSTGLAETCSQQLSQHLQACGAGFSVTEERQSDSMSSRRLAASSHAATQSTQWASSVGYLLASLGTTPTTPATPASPTASMPVTGSFVSFSIEAGRSVYNG